MNGTDPDSPQGPSAPRISKVLITGGAGFLARHITETLKQKYTLTLFDRAPMESECSCLAGDITDAEAVLRACAGQDAVVHTVALVRERAGKPAGLFADVVVKGTWNLLEACVAQKVKRLVNISSIIADGRPAPRWPPYRAGEPPRYAKGDLHYCVSKKLGEVLADAYGQAYDLSVIHLRPGVIDRDGANPALTRRPAGVSLPWFMYVDPRDVAQAVECALSTAVRCGTYHIVAGRQDALFDWQTAAREIGYAPQHNWPTIPEV